MTSLANRSITGKPSCIDTMLRFDSNFNRGKKDYLAKTVVKSAVYVFPADGGLMYGA